MLVPHLHGTVYLCEYPWVWGAGHTRLRSVWKCTHMHMSQRAGYPLASETLGLPGA